MHKKYKTTTAIGSEAEASTAEYLKSLGHNIIAQNWRNRWCEIDIISTHKHCVYFTEVKYRETDNWGDGLDAITPKKLKQMHFAAELWITTNSWPGDATLAVASVTGQDYKISDFFEIY